MTYYRNYTLNEFFTFLGNDIGQIHFSLPPKEISVGINTDIFSTHDFYVVKKNCRPIVGFKFSGIKN